MSDDIYATEGKTVCSVEKGRIDRFGVNTVPRQNEMDGVCVCVFFCVVWHKQNQTKTIENNGLVDDAVSGTETTIDIVGLRLYCNVTETNGIECDVFG